MKVHAVKPACFLLLFFSCLGASSQLPHQLLVGDKVPVLPVDKWIKGGPVNVYEKGAVYVVDFWAVWCGPCIAGMEHLSAWQLKYGKQGLKVIGVTSEDAWGNSYDKVIKFLQSKGNAYDYNFVWAPESFRSDKKYKSVIYHPWLQAAYDSSSWALPQVFIIDRSGRLAFIGDGYAMSEDYLVNVLNNKHDVVVEREKYIAKSMIENEAAQFAAFLEKKKFQEAVALGNKIVKNEAAPPHALLVVCDFIFNKDLVKDNSALLSLGLQAAIKGVKLTDNKAPSQLAVLAKAYADTNNIDLAVATIKSAMDLADGDFKEAMRKDLIKYEGQQTSKK